MNTQIKGYVIHQGNDNGEPFVVIATMESKNRKTGKMVQVWILLENHSPVEGVKLGLDAFTVCKGCPFASGNGCYVNVGQAPLSIWKSYHRGIYPELRIEEFATIFAGLPVRFGAYGNPSLIPLDKVEAIAKVAKGWTGYFHDWQDNPLRDEYAKFFMVSTETESSFKLAMSLKFRAFHVSPIQPKETIECLSESKGMECKDCKLCAGLAKKRIKSIWINPHGSKSKKAAAVAMA
jgi:hypothetical protein